jgi:DUF2892 family protein
MKRDVGTADRIIRIAAGLFLLLQATMNGQPWGYFGIVPLLTGAVGWCPLYRMLGVSTLCGCSGASCQTKQQGGAL